MKVCLYLEFLHFKNGALFKDLGTGLLSSYKNQKVMLERMGIEFVEKWEDDCDILQINTPWLKSLFMMKKAKRMGKPVVVWAHVTAEDIRGVFRFSSVFSPIMKWYLKYAYNQADLIFCPSEYTRKLIIAYGISGDKVVAQSNGVDLKKFYKSDEKREAGRKEYKLSKIVVGTVALVIPRKGTHTFLALAKKLQDIDFIWVGKIYSGALVEALPKEIPSNVQFTGYAQDILAAFNSFDIFIFPSYEENQGMVILEAAAIGLPILVRDIPVYEGWLVHGENCLKAKTEEEFLKYTTELRDNKELREKLGKNALKLAEENSIETLSTKLQSTYNKLLQK